MSLRFRRHVRLIAGSLISALIVAAAASAPVEGSSAFAAIPAGPTAHTASGAIQFKATGFFRTGFAHGRWWLVTPDGHPFYSSGVDHVSANPDTDQRTGQCPYCATITSKYPNVSDWATATVARLQSWGFNTIGSFSDYASFASHMPYTELLSMASGNDWFASSFATNAESVAQSQVAALANDPNLIGWYTDSELHWGTDWRSSNVVLSDYLALPTGSPGLTVAMRYRHNPNGFVRALATRYFSVTTAAIHHYDPHHLILGVKAPAQLIQPELLKVARHYVDVFSIDDYSLIPGLEHRADREQAAHDGRIRVSGGGQRAAQLLASDLSHICHPDRQGRGLQDVPHHDVRLAVGRRRCLVRVRRRASRRKVWRWGEQQLGSCQCH